MVHGWKAARVQDHRVEDHHDRMEAFVSMIRVYLDRGASLNQDSGS